MERESPRYDNLIQETNLAYFGCGCFWTKEFLFGKLPGVHATRTGYMGGHTHHPNYHLVCSKTTGHAEVVEITYDPKEISFETLLKGFFSLHDSTRDRSGRGGQYRSVVFWRKREERTFLEQQLEELLAAGLSVSTSIEKASIFWEAEPRHQGYVTRTGRHCELLTTNDIFNETIAEVVRKRIR